MRLTDLRIGYVASNSVSVTSWLVQTATFLNYTQFKEQSSDELRRAKILLAKWLHTVQVMLSHNRIVKNYGGKKKLESTRVASAMLSKLTPETSTLNDVTLLSP